MLRAKVLELETQLAARNPTPTVGEDGQVRSSQNDQNTRLESFGVEHFEHFSRPEPEHIPEELRCADLDTFDHEVYMIRAERPKSANLVRPQSAATHRAGSVNEHAIANTRMRPSSAVARNMPSSRASSKTGPSHTQRPQSAKTKHVKHGRRHPLPLVTDQSLIGIKGKQLSPSSSPSKSPPGRPSAQRSRTQRSIAEAGARLYQQQGSPERYSLLANNDGEVSPDEFRRTRNKYVDNSTKHEQQHTWVSVNGVATLTRVRVRGL